MKWGYSLLKETEGMINGNIKTTKMIHGSYYTACNHTLGRNTKKPEPVKVRMFPARYHNWNLCPT